LGRLKGLLADQGPVLLQAVGLCFWPAWWAEVWGAAGGFAAAFLALMFAGFALGRPDEPVVRARPTPLLDDGGQQRQPRSPRWRWLRRRRGPDPMMEHVPPREGEQEWI
jgi:hypothetical protein